MFSQFKIITPFHTIEAMRTRLAWYVNLRWLTIFAILAVVPLGQRLLNFDLPYHMIILIASVLLWLNVSYFMLCRYMPRKNMVQELIFAQVQIVGDLLIVSLLIHFSGGIENPFFFLYIVQVILSAIMLPGHRLPVINAVLAAVLITVWTLLEYMQWVPAYTLGEARMSKPYIVTALAAFYITNFAGLYIIQTFMIRYRHLKELIDKKNRLLEKSIRERKTIFRYAAHELKSPLGVIKSTLQAVRVLSGDILPPEVADMVLRGENRSAQVMEMVNEMIAITRYNQGVEKHVPEWIDFQDWLNQVVELQRDFALTKRIHLQMCRIPEPIRVRIDKIDMERVARNLVNNALRYTPEGGEVVVKPFLSPLSFGFSVRDSGIGIARKDLKKIFNEFYRAANAKEMERVGTGLGLILVKEIMRRNGGTIRVKSTLGKGSVFTIEFPLTPAAHLTSNTEIVKIGSG
ncbi:HAMP domain-containing histidine kinase [candidate division KSB1 bacterium]|nr:HAMP domain-containing histidine kinase [candidate division KSB1 bacterium]